MYRIFTSTVLATLALAAPAAASNSSLLSGYSGPGGGEQTILGQQGVGGGHSAAAGGIPATQGALTASSLAQQGAANSGSRILSTGIDQRTGAQVRATQAAGSGPAVLAPPAGYAGYEQLAGRSSAASPLGGLSLPLILLGAAALALTALALRKGSAQR